MQLFPKSQCYLKERAKLQYLAMNVAYEWDIFMTISPPAAVAAPTAPNPQSGSLSRGFHRAALRLQDESKSDKPPSSSSSSSTTYHEHGHRADEDPAGAPRDAAGEASRPNTRSVR